MLIWNPINSPLPQKKQQHIIVKPQKLNTFPTPKKS